MASIPSPLNATVAPSSEHLLPAPKVAAQFGITRRTLSRWLADASLGFPKPVEINGRLYFAQHEIDAWKTSRARRGDLGEAA